MLVKCLLLVVSCLLFIFESGGAMSMQCRVEQRAVIKFMVAQGAIPIHCWRQLQQVYGQRAVSKTQFWFWLHVIYCWHGIVGMFFVDIKSWQHQIFVSVTKNRIQIGLF